MKYKRLILVLAFGLVLVAGTAVALFFRYAHPEGSGPAGLKLNGESFMHPWTSRRILMVGLGDSVTAGFGARKGYGYFDRLAKNPADEFPDMQGICLSGIFPNLLVTNLAVSGSTSDEVINRQLAALSTNDASVHGLMIMTTGGNDIIHNYGRTPPREEAMYGATLEEAQPWINNFSNRLKEIIAQIQNHFPGGCDIFIANIFDPTDGVGEAELAGLPHWPEAMKILAAYNAVIQGCAGRNHNVHLVDIHQAFLGHGLHCTQFWRDHFDWRDPHYWLFVNLEDPNERGYDAIRRLFLEEILKTKNFYLP